MGELKVGDKIIIKDTLECKWSTEGGKAAMHEAEAFMANASKPDLKEFYSKMTDFLMAIDQGIEPCVESEKAVDQQLAIMNLCIQMKMKERENLRKKHLGLLETLAVVSTIHKGAEKKLVGNADISALEAQAEAQARDAQAAVEQAKATREREHAEEIAAAEAQAAENLEQAVTQAVADANTEHEATSIRLKVEAKFANERHDRNFKQMAILQERVKKLQGKK